MGNQKSNLNIIIWREIRRRRILEGAPTFPRMKTHARFINTLPVSYQCYWRRCLQRCSFWRRSHWTSHLQNSNLQTTSFQMSRLWTSFSRTCRTGKTVAKEEAASSDLFSKHLACNEHQQLSGCIQDAKYLILCKGKVCLLT